MNSAIIKTVIGSGLFLLVTGTALAQHRGVIRGGRGGGFGVIGGGHEFRTFGSPSGFGNVVFPGTGSAPRLFNPFAAQAPFAQRFGAIVSGSPGFAGAPTGRFHHNVPIIIPYAYPVYAGGYYPLFESQYYQQGYQQQPNVTIVLPPQATSQAQPPVTIQQNFRPETAQSSITEYPADPEENTAVRSYQAPAPVPQDASGQDVMFLIALKDSSVYSAVAYWVQGDTLHYITPQGRHNQVSLTLVDRGVSDRLNQGRKVDFRLPPARK